MNKTENNTTSNSEMVTISRAEYESLKDRNAELVGQVEYLMEQMRLARAKRFGASSEQTNEDGMEQLSYLFNEAEVYANEVAEPVATPVVAHSRKRKSGAVKDILPENIETVEIIHGLSEAERICPQCGETMVEIGREVREHLAVQPAKAYLQRDIYMTYACKPCENNDIATPVVQTPKEPALIPGSYASASAVAHFAVQKFVMGSPLYRQEKEWNRLGIQLSRQTMSNWLLRAAHDWLTPVYDALHQELLKQEVLHADETTLQVLREPGKKATSKSYMWLYRTSGDAIHPIVLYQYQPDRKAEHPQEFLAGFQGYLHTDGYAGYHNLPKEITVVGCWAHARRYFDEAVKALPKGKQSAGSAPIGLAYCTQLFHIETELAGLSPKERQKQRLKQEKPVLDDLFAWAKTRAATPKSALGKALHYVIEQKPYLENYLKDERLELSNNRAERSIKPFVIDRKNFLFANTPEGATGSAVIFSLIETAKENGLDPFRYLLHVLKTAPNLDQTAENWVSPLLPQNAPATCKVPQKEKTK